MIDSTFGNYKIVEKLGEGGMGVVYRAKDVELDRMVAVKTLLSHSADQEGLARFMREARAASRLQHPAIVTIHHFGVEGDTRFIVMEFVEGKTLKRIISGQPMHMSQLCEIAIQMADALALAHEKGVIHRDMKAENVMVTTRGQVKILDFGLAKLKDPHAGKEEQETAYTQAGMIIGTISHMSPEQAMGAEVDPRTDIFSLGVVLYEMATGQMPFHGPTPQATLARILNHHPQPVSELNGDVPPALERLIVECLSKDRAARPAAESVVTRLKNIQASLSASGLLAPEVRADLPTVAMTPSGAGLGPASSAASGAPAGRLPSGIAPTPPSSRGQAAPREVAPPSYLRSRAVYLIVKTFRVALGWALLSIPLAFLAYLIIGAGLIRPQIVEGTWFLRFITAVVAPVLAVSENIFTFRTVYNGWNLMLVPLGFAALLARQAILLPVDKVVHWAKSEMIRSMSVGENKFDLRSGKLTSQRLSMLRDYAQAQETLMQDRRSLAFLSVDIVGSTKMKVGEDKLVVEHAFSEYKKFVDRILKANSVWKVAWTPDGIMCAFHSLDNAVRSGQEILRSLPWFNDGVHRLRTPFSVRCGVHAGDVVFPEARMMEEISDESIDVAGHMQKQAAPGALWISDKIASSLRDQNGFVPLPGQNVDGFPVLEWRAEALPKSGIQSA
jgi:serine/threonine protein kinase/class 3 adenylate cyclase